MLALQSLLLLLLQLHHDLHCTSQELLRLLLLLLLPAWHALLRA